jgi:kinesin family member 2/24
MTDVFIRKKPLLEKDTEIVRCINDKMISVTRKIKSYDGRLKNKITKFNFNGVIDDTQNNNHIFNKFILNNLDDDLTCFMYGQTGSGKTHTVLGEIDDEGIFIRAGKELMENSDELYISAYQIYNDNIYDLLGNNNKLKIYENKNHKFKIPNLTNLSITNMNELYRCVNIIIRNRAQSSNNINMTSSRSHAILIYKYIKDESIINIKLIDLAGNERSKNSKIKSLSSRLENKHINFSLFSLKECIRNIEKGKRHIPFRRSKLTSVLRECFISHHKSIMIATICSNNDNYSDIINTLNYSNKVNKFLNKPAVVEKYVKKKKINTISLPELKIPSKNNIHIIDDLSNYKSLLYKIIDTSRDTLSIIESKKCNYDSMRIIRKKNKIILNKLKIESNMLNNIKEN